MYSLGVDIGTTFVAAAIARDDQVEMVSLGDRSVATPSVVYLREDGSLLTGDAAARRAVSNPDRQGREFKRRLGDPTPVMLGGTSQPVTTLLAALLRDVLTSVTETEGGKPDRVVLTHPANWGPFRRGLFEEVPALAGLENPPTVTEPVAAAAHYASSHALRDGEVIAVYDLGGGTFDATVLRARDGGVEILGSPEGIERLGGVDFDEAVLAHVNHASGGVLDDLDLRDPTTSVALARLRQDCVLAKEALSVDTETVVPVFLPGRHFDVTITRAELEDMVRAPLETTVTALARTLRSAHVEASELSAVLLVGGSSRIPLVAEMVAAEIGRPTVVDTHPKYAVALGAAILADALPESSGRPYAPAARTSPPSGPMPVVGPPSGGFPAGGGYRPDQPYVQQATTAAPPAGPPPAPQQPSHPPATPTDEGLTTAFSPGGAGTRPADEAATVGTGAGRSHSGHSGGSGGTRPPGPTGPARVPAEDDAPTGPIGPVPPTGPAAATSPPPPPRPSGAPSRRRILAVVAGVLALALVVGAAVVGFRVLGASTPQEEAADAPPPTTVAASVPIPTLGATIPAGQTPGYAQVSPNGRLVYVANRTAGVVTVVDTSVNAVTATIAITSGPPQYLTFSPDGKRVYVSVFDDARTIAAVSVLDTTTNQVVATIPVQTRPFAAAVSPDGSRLWVPNHDSGSISVIDTASNTLIRDVKVKPNPHWVEFSRDGTRAYTPNHESNLITVLDTATYGVIAEVPVGTSPHSVAVNPVRPLLANVNYDSDNVTVIDTTTNTLVATIPVGDNPQEITWAPDGRFAYVANNKSNTVSVIDAQTLAVTATLPTPAGPSSVTVTPDGRTGYVSTIQGGVLAVLNLS
ncbi:YVTN family beta-propeller protein [Actinomycetospora succinea]|uniref:YVTN family beta-propeller protein n=1 Tax=Actinomycetospora succinea TaxID=663603 RepID=A0A4R6VI43_9PSEU|nr:Hsp70 family protein [Actinomycetospora succinea]TDQ61067.1 YVTN family beta-propeller protein [Actinomycetospora succinea]